MHPNTSPGQLIRELRQKHHLSGEALAQKAGLSQTKISKIETGNLPNVKKRDIDAILNILNAPQTIRQQILTSNDPAGSRTYNFRQGRSFTETLHRLRDATFTRTFMINLVPALLQTNEYRASFLKRNGFNDQIFAQAMKTTLKRQDMLWDKHKRFHFIISEAALYTTPGNHLMQRVQLDRVERFIGTFSNIKIGIIPLEVGLAPVENGTFVVYDERRVVNVLAGGEMVSEEPADITSYLKLFTELDRKADYGDAARQILNKATTFFSER